MQLFTAHLIRHQTTNSKLPLRGFSLIDLLVVLAMLGLLIALLLPALRASQEKADLLKCANNLKQIGLSLHNYHDTFLSLPIGSRGAGYTKDNPTATQDYAKSWQGSILAFADQQEVAFQWDHVAGNGFNGGDPADPKTNMQLIDGLVPDWSRCPASPLPKLVLKGKHGTAEGRLLPTYVGVAGGVTQKDWLYHDDKRLQPQTGKAQGILAGNGALLANESCRLADFRDGISYTMLVAEQSDYHTVGENKEKQLTNSGGAVGAWAGAAGYGIVGETSSKSTPQAWNITSVRYPFKQKHYDELPDGMVATTEKLTLGNNNGIVSVHQGGAVCVLGDGRVSFINEKVDQQILVYLCIRDDGVRIDRGEE
jgi:type II secretory pathway pseudopilin PulG